MSILVLVLVSVALLLLLLLALYVFPVTARSIAKSLLTIWWANNLPRLFYQRQSDYCNNMIELCSILTERYSPPLWGYIGHIQTFMFSIFGRLKDYKVNGTRHQFCIQSDGSVVSYDLFEPSGDNVQENIVFFILPGINNSAETDYIRAFVSFSLDRGYRVAALNHLGALNTPIQGSRIFTYGGTGDTALMYNDLIKRYGDSVQFVGVGYSLGGSILLKFLGEDKTRQNHFLCAFSFCQGYCPVTATHFWHSWTELRRFYNFAICKRMINLLKRHQEKLFNHSPQNTNDIATNNMIHLETTSVPAQERDSNGFATNSNNILNPDSRIWSANCMLQFDDYYFRRVMGFESVKEMYQWSSCVPSLEKIPSLPIIFVNAIDDPLIPEELQVFPKEYIKEHNPNAMLIQTEHGGHLGFFEGGFICPNKLTWIDRLIFEYVPVARRLRRKFS